MEQREPLPTATPVVGTPDHRYLWMLSRTPHLDEPTYQRLICWFDLFIWFLWLICLDWFNQTNQTGWRNFQHPAKTLLVGRRPTALPCWTGPAL
jgi:hypothetical protein